MFVYRWRGGFGISCLVVVAISARLSLLRVHLLLEWSSRCSAVRQKQKENILFDCVFLQVCISFLGVIVSIPAMHLRCVSKWLGVIITP